MTPIYICVHEDGSYSWVDPANGHTVENTTQIPNRVWERVPDEERRRISRRREKIRDVSGCNLKTKTGLKVSQIRRMMAEQRKQMRG